MPPPDPADRIRNTLAHLGPNAAWYAIETASAALEAGRRAIRDRREDLTEAERFATALQAAIETLEGIGLKLAEGERPAQQEG